MNGEKEAHLEREENRSTSLSQLLIQRVNSYLNYSERNACTHTDLSLSFFTFSDSVTNMAHTIPNTHLAVQVCIIVYWSG